MPIYLQKEPAIKGAIKNRKVRLAVVGVGTIGLPLATFLASKGFKVTAFDVSKERAAAINNGLVKFEYTKLLNAALEKKTIHATTDPAALKPCDVIFVCVPTPLNRERSIDLTILESASEAIAKNMSRGTVVVFESSVAIGSTRKMISLIERVSGMKVNRDFGVAYCPERYNPTLPTESMPHVVYEGKDSGNKFTVDKVARVISGSDQKSAAIAKSIYSKFITSPIKELSSIETAEATKLLENIFRDVNIALANEMAKLLPKLGVDAFEVVDAAKTKPFAFLPHYPGAGVGGECIPVDTWYLIKQAEDIGFDTKLMRTAREVNDSMPVHVVELLKDALAKSGRKVSGSRITVLGLAYKKNIADARVSPSAYIVDILRGEGADVVVSDPFMEHSRTKERLVPLSEAFRQSDAVILATDHDLFRGIDLAKAGKEMRTRVLIDGRNFFSEKDAAASGFTYKSVGKPI